MQMSDDNVVALSLLNSIKAIVVKRSVMMIETLDPTSFLPFKQE